MYTKNDERIHILFDQLVPPEGKAETVAGEIVRALSRLRYRNWNDGDHIGVGYGKETCNAAARFLQASTNDEVRKVIDDIWGIASDRLYDAGLVVLEDLVLDHLDKHPELRTSPNQEDMFDYYIAEEDEDREEEEYCDEDDGWWG